MADMQSLEKMRTFFRTGATKGYLFRKKQLKKLKQALLEHESELHEALYTDLKKSPEESWVTETGFLLSEINNALRNLGSWMEEKHTGTNLVNLPSKSFVMPEPMGVVLIIGPWNYPLQLLFTPLVGTIAAGNCTVLKPSEFAPATASVMKRMIEETFEKDYILFTEGAGEVVVPSMMNNFTFDYVFYTGSTTVGKIIYKMAAEKLVPVTLELGGKSPCVIEEDANLHVAARRIAVAKFSNCGQMCVAPDFILVHEAVKEKFINTLKDTLTEFFGEQPESSYSYGKMINVKHFNRVMGYLKEGEIIHGGRSDREKLFIEPTILENIRPGSSVMTDEIFGPVLPVIGFRNFEEAKAAILENPNPLSFYIFTSGKEREKKWLNTIPFGGGCINNCSWHLTNHHLPFGGRGYSGMGNYHGKYSFDTFSHKKAVMKTPTWFDPDIKYPPFEGKLKLFKWVIR